MLSGCSDSGPYQKESGIWFNVGHCELQTLRRKLKPQPESLKILNQNPDFAKSPEHVYYYDRVLNDIDAKSFVFFNKTYSKDKNRVYILKEGSLYPVADADPSSFKAINSLQSMVDIDSHCYGKDSKHVFCGSIAMNLTDISKFQIVKPGFYNRGASPFSGEPTVFEEKNKFVEKFGNEFESLEVSKEKPIIVPAHAWARDGKYYYYGPAKVTEADYKTFKIDSDLLHAQDKNHKFKGPLLVE